MKKRELPANNAVCSIEAGERTPRRGVVPRPGSDRPSSDRRSERNETVILIGVSERFEEIEAVYQAIGRELFDLDSDDLRKALAERDPNEAAFFALILVDAEIGNGGFWQLFTNSTGDLTEQAIAGAERFGLGEHARLLRDASAALYPEGIPLDGEERLRLYDEWVTEDRFPADEEAMEALDERWFALDDVLTQRLYAYAREHPPS